MDKNKRLIEYIENYPALYPWLFFNVINIEQGTAAMLTDTDRAIAEYTDGKQEREYLFTIAMMKQFDTGTSDVNVQALAEAQAFNAWIVSNDQSKTFPDWGSENIINSIESLDAIPTLSVDDSQGVARYTMQMRINYLKLGGK